MFKRTQRPPKHCYHCAGRFGLARYSSGRLQFCSDEIKHRTGEVGCRRKHLDGIEADLARRRQEPLSA